MGSPIPVVLPSDLGIDFDIGNQTADKINIVMATETVYGKVRYATSSELSAGTQDVAIDAADLKEALQNLIPFATYTTPGVVIINAAYLNINEGVLSVNIASEIVSLGGAHLGWCL